MPNPSAREILLQARDIIAATYWCQDTEVVFLVADELDEVAKYLTLREDGEDVYVSSVCSIGAMAVARCQKTGKELSQFSEMFESDFNMMRAGYALAGAIFDGSDPTAAPGDRIAEWNDESGRTRKQVLKAFEKSLESPLLTAKALWSVQVDSTWDSNDLPAFTFPTKKEAQEVADKLQSYVGSNKKPAKIYQDTLDQFDTSIDSPAFSVAKVNTPSAR